MRIIPILIAITLSACAPAEKEVLTTSVDVDQSELQALLNDIDSLSGNSLPVDEMLDLAISTPMDDEQQERFSFAFQGSDEEILFHVWREQVDWVHLYFSSTSKELIAALEKNNSRYARDDEP